MGLWTSIKERMNGGERVIVVWSRDHNVEFVSCIVDVSLKLIRSGDGRSWPKPAFDPTGLGKDVAYLATGEKIIPWPTREKPAYDVLDDGTKIEITPEYLDLLTRDTDTEAWLRGVRGMSVMDRLIHLGAGAAIGMALTFFLLKLIGFVGSKTGGSGTTVTITNATANATTLATAMATPFLHAATIHAWGWPL